MIGYTDGSTELGAKNQMHIYGDNSLITAKSKIDYNAPEINKLPQKGMFKYDKEKQIINAQWIEPDNNTAIHSIGYEEKISLLVQTRNYKKGETISVVVDEVQGGDINDGVKEITLIGEVDEAGFALLKEQLVVEKSKKTEQEKLEKQQREEERKATEVYKTYQGKDYTYNEWVVKEQELWEEYQRTKKRK